MKIGIIGLGNIGRIYARSFLKYNLVSNEKLFLIAKNSEQADVLEREMNCKAILADDPLAGACDLLFIAVKPQDFSGLSSTIGIRPHQIVISVMAGITMQRIADTLQHDLIVRAMPNSPIQLGMGMTGFCASEKINRSQLRMVEQLLSTTGRTAFFEDEEKMDAVTALSGSGPAYVYYFLKAMMKAGEEMGFNQAESAMLVNQTILGAFHLMNSSVLSLDELIKTVASKGGTTEAALSVFDEQDVLSSLAKGVLAAERRGKELAAAR